MIGTSEYGSEIEPQIPRPQVQCRSRRCRRDSGESGRRDRTTTGERVVVENFTEEFVPAERWVDVAESGRSDRFCSEVVDSHSTSFTVRVVLPESRGGCCREEGSVVGVDW